MKTAIVTASYAGDFERCVLLCDTIDRYVTGFTKHYLLVEEADVTLFRQLESRHRCVISERDLLPSWLKVVPDPFSLGKRRVWLSLRTLSLRGWHVQQMRRIGFAALAEEDAFCYVDSDVAFIRSFDVRTLWQGSTLRLLRRYDALDCDSENHQAWFANAGTLLNIERADMLTHDYIGTLIAWRRDAVRSLIRHIEDCHDNHWVEAMGQARRFSECMIYGRYVDGVLKGEGHFRTGSDLCEVYWNGPPLNEDQFRDFVGTLASEQVAIGVQSFVGLNMGSMRKYLDALAL